MAIVKRKSRWQQSARKVTMAAQNALELIQTGRLSEPYSAGFDVLHSDARYTLRRYQGTLAANRRTSSPLLLIPPLMLTAEIYDISADLSAAAMLVREGIDVWVTDFRTPEAEEGGLARTLDDHVTAVGDAIERIREMTRQDVHLAGYSQGGMFAYQCAAFRRSEGIASVITFGSPVDIHRTVPNFSDAFAHRVTQAMRSVLGGPLSRVEGLPGTFTSLAFKMLGLRKELGQFADFLGKLHDRQALEKREARRLFLRGDGFVAWPGPAFRTFVDDFVVANRMATGGFVIQGKTVTLADIRCPVLCFVGERDEMAAPAAVRAIHSAAPNAEISEVSVMAGHFGLVVGSESLRRTWPTVAEWVRWRDGEGAAPRVLLEGEGGAEEDDFESMHDDVLDFDLALDVAGKFARSAWDRLEEVAENVSDSADHLRYQIPRLRRLRNMDATTRTSFALALDEQAQSIPARTFFLWQGRAFAYADSNERVNNIVRGLIACGVLPTQRIGVLMGGRPSYLSLVAAINRIGAVAVLMDPKSAPSMLADALTQAEVAKLVVDPENATRARSVFAGEILVLGGGSEGRRLGSDFVDMEAINPAAVKMPAWYQANPGRAADLAMIIISPATGGNARVLHITNHRWAFSAYGAAASATLTPKDTVYCCLPLHHAAGTMVSVGSALVSGARLALADGFSPTTFWSETRRYGATVVFYAGEMCRELVDAPQSRAEGRHPIRLFAGSGMRKDVWERLVERFGPVGVLEFYASTETNAVLANASGLKAGAVGNCIPGSSPVALVRFDLETGEVVRGAAGHCVPCPPGEPGLMLTRANSRERGALRASRIMHSVFAPQDIWYSTRNLLRQDEDGDYWFVERVEDLVRGAQGLRLCLPLEDALYTLDGVALCAVYGTTAPEGELQTLVAAVVARAGKELGAEALDKALAPFEISARPALVYLCKALPMTDGFRPSKSLLRAEAVPADEEHFALDPQTGRYSLVTEMTSYSLSRNDGF